MPSNAWFTISNFVDNWSGKYVISASLFNSIYFSKALQD